MSLNCDIVVMRNGRSTSQVSIYNYPEHLNPFYEDDQHKRLRFWHIKNNNNSGRRNSFSMSGLKDIWTFKSFRLKKKSSTLGINKTSESPPSLRREIEYVPSSNNGFYTYDPRKRYTDSFSDSNFQRNATCRRSLQNMNSGQNTYNGLGFNRNDKYRGTIQVNTDVSLKSVSSPRRYVYGGSLTPQPLRNPDKKHYNGQLIQGTSQTSISTNPFDSDVDETISIDETIQRSKKATSQRNQHKKRRAPAPPDLQLQKLDNQTLILDSSQKSSSHCEELRIEEDISSLTAEIENFVKTSNDNTEKKLKNKQSNLLDKLKTTTMQTAIPITTCQDKTSESIRVNPGASTQTMKTKMINNLEITSSTTNNIEALEKSTVIKHTPFNVNNNNKNEKCIQETDKQQTRHMECIPIHINSLQAPTKNYKDIKLSSFQSDQKEPNKNLPISENHAQANVGSTKVDVPTKAVQQKTFTTHTENELVISEDTVLGKPTTQNKPPIPAKPILEGRNSIKITPEVHKSIKSTDTTNSEPMKVDVTFIPSIRTENLTTTTTFAPEPLKTHESYNTTVEVDFKPLYRTQPRSPLEWKHSTLAPLEIHVPPERRRSVKDIIESINRSQRLLHNAAHKYDITSSTSELNNFDESINCTASTNCNDKIYVSIKSTKTSNAAQPEKGHISSYKVNDISENISAKNNTNKDPLKLINEDTFQKCKVNKESHDFRESSPTTSNLDWNPVPKPKRTKNL